MKKVLLNFLFIMFSFNLMLNAQVQSQHRVKAVAYKNYPNQERINVLWGQNMNPFPGYAYGAASCFFGNNSIGHQIIAWADDFTVPAGKTWIIDTIETSFLNLKGLANSYDIYIYGDAGGNSGPNRNNTLYHDNFTVTNILVNYWYWCRFYVGSVNLPQGKYWLSFVGRQDTARTGSAYANGYTALTGWIFRDTSLAGCMGTLPAYETDSTGFDFPSVTPWQWVYYDTSIAQRYVNMRFQLGGIEQNAGVSEKLAVDNGIISAYPVPAGNTITFQTSSKEGNIIEIYNTLGEKITTINLNGKNIVDVDISSYGNGIYFYELKSKIAVLGTGKFVKE